MFVRQELTAQQVAAWENPRGGAVVPGFEMHQTSEVLALDHRGLAGYVQGERPVPQQKLTNVHGNDHA